MTVNGDARAGMFVLSTPLMIMGPAANSNNSFSASNGDSSSRSNTTNSSSSSSSSTGSAWQAPRKPRVILNGSEVVLVGDRIGGRNNSATSRNVMDWQMGGPVVTPAPQASLVSGVCRAAAVVTGRCGGGTSGTGAGADDEGGDHSLQSVVDKLASDVMLNLQQQRDLVELSRPGGQAVATAAGPIMVSLQFKQLTLMGLAQGLEPATAAAGMGDSGQAQRRRLAGMEEQSAAASVSSTSSGSSSSTSSSSSGSSGSSTFSGSSSTSSGSSGSSTSSGRSEEEGAVPRILAQTDGGGNGSSDGSRGSQRAAEVWTHLLWAVKRYVGWLRGGAVVVLSVKQQLRGDRDTCSGVP